MIISVVAAKNMLS